MNRRKLFSLIALMLAMVLLFAGCSKKEEAKPSTNGAAKSDKPIEMTFGDTAQGNMAPGLSLKWAVDKINADPNSNMNISYHGQSTIGNDADLMQQVMSGQIQIAGVSIGAFSQYTPLLETVQLPFLLGTYQEERDALNSPEFKALVEKVEKQYNVKILTFLENGMRHFATIDKPVNTIADVKGVKLRVAPSVIIQKAMSMIGANPMSITYGEVSTALQNRTIDGEEINITSAGSQKHYEVIKYISEVGFYPYPGAYVINGDFYKSLSDSDKKLLTDTFKAAQDKVFDELLPKSEETFRKECSDNGVTFNKVQDLEPFKAAVAGLYKEYSDKDPAIKAFIDKYNK